jgi:uncharacterized repeat protein (TIGR01451 family)
MNGRRSAGKALLLLTGLLAVAATAAPGQGRSEPVWTRFVQVPEQEPPPGERAPPPYLPAVPGGLGKPGAGARGLAGTPYPVREAVHPATPVVSIRVEAPSTATPGRELEYRIVVENRSRGDANHVRVDVPVPSNARYKTAQPAPTSAVGTSPISWNLGTLKGGQQREIVLVVEPTGGDDIACCARVTFEHGECVRTKIAKPALRVRTDGPERGKLYDTLTFTVEVTNAGQVDATDVILTEELPPGLDFSDSNPSTSGKSPLTWKLGTLSPNQTRRVQFIVIAQRNGSHVLKATAAAAGLKAVEGNVSRVLVGEPQLSLIKTGPAFRSQDLTATYLLTVSNAGLMPATGIVLADGLFATPATRSNIEFVQASDNGKLVGNDVTWNLGTLEGGSRRTVSLTVRLLPSAPDGEFRNVAEVKADRGLRATAFAITKFQPANGLTLDVDKASDPVAVGKTTAFTFRIRQRGAVPATKVGLTVTLPEGLQYVDARGLSAGTQKDRTVTFDPLGELAPGAEAVYTVVARAERAAEVKVLATVTADPAPKGGKLEFQETTIIVPDSAIPPSAPPPVLAPDGGKAK